MVVDSRSAVLKSKAHKGRNKDEVKTRLSLKEVIKSGEKVEAPDERMKTYVMVKLNTTTVIRLLDHGRHIFRAIVGCPFGDLTEPYDC